MCWKISLFRDLKAVKVQIVQLGIPLNYLVLASSKKIFLTYSAKMGMRQGKFHYSLTSPSSQGLNPRLASNTKNV